MKFVNVNKFFCLACCRRIFLFVCLFVSAGELSGCQTRHGLPSLPVCIHGGGDRRRAGDIRLWADSWGSNLKTLQQTDRQHTVWLVHNETIWCSTVILLYCSRILDLNCSDWHGTELKVWLFQLLSDVMCWCYFLVLSQTRFLCWNSVLKGHYTKLCFDNIWLLMQGNRN